MHDKPIGGTEIMFSEFLRRIDKNLLNEVSIFNYIKDADFSKKTIYWNQLSYDQDAVQFLKDNDIKNNIDHFVFVSHWQAEKFRVLYNIPGYKTHVIKNACLDIPRKTFYENKEKIRICYTSTPWRGLAVLLKAWELIKPINCELHIFSSTQIYGSHFFCVADHNYTDLYEKAKGLPNVSYRGFVENGQLRNELPTFDIMAYPCIFEETSCISVIEALSAGLKVVCSNIGALPETTEGWANMYPIRVDEDLHAEEFSKQLLKTIEDLRNGLYDNSLKEQEELYRKRWSWDSRIEEWNLLLNKIQKDRYHIHEMTLNEVKSLDMFSVVNVFTKNVNNDKVLKNYRDWIEANSFGFGERCFLWMWKIIVDQMPNEFTFVEIGVYKGQILGIIRVLAERVGKKVIRIGITPLDSSDGHVESDYEKDIEILHDTFNIPKDYSIIKGLSTDSSVIESAKNLNIDILYIDGGHDYLTIINDLTVYPNFVKEDGFLVIDDCNNNFDMPNGYFKGIQEVSKATDEIMPPSQYNPHWEFEFNVIHNRVLRKVKNEKHTSIKSQRIPFNENDVIIDIGSRTGSFAKKCVQEGVKQVLCFEASPKNFHILNENLKDYINVTLSNLAVWSKSGLNISFNTHENESLQELSGTAFTLNGNVRVNTICLDEILENYEKVRLLNIDAEGSEYPIILSSNLIEKVEELACIIYKIDQENDLVPPLSYNKKLSQNDIFNYLKKFGFDIIEKTPINSYKTFFIAKKLDK